jgi:hypothetical protein
MGRAAEFFLVRKGSFLGLPFQTIRSPSPTKFGDFWSTKVRFLEFFPGFSTFWHLIEKPQNSQNFQIHH